MENQTVVNLLVTAITDEWLSHYQYWICKNISRGEGKFDADAEFDAHEADEKKHADMLVQRLKELGGTPVSAPEDWSKVANPFIPADTRNVKRLLAITIEAERTAIEFYKSALDTVNELDVVTSLLFKQILADEVKHYYDLQEVLASLDADTTIRTASRKETSSESVKHTYHCFDIDYDIDLEFEDCDETDLPEDIYVKLEDGDMTEDEILDCLSDAISERTGFFHNGFYYEIV